MEPLIGVSGIYLMDASVAVDPSSVYKISAPSIGVNIVTSPSELLNLIVSPAM